jgi:hypothetical protein
MIFLKLLPHAPWSTGQQGKKPTQAVGRSVQHLADIGVTVNPRDELCFWPVSLSACGGAVR